MNLILCLIENGMTRNPLDVPFNLILLSELSGIFIVAFLLFFLLNSKVKIITFKRALIISFIGMMVSWMLGNIIWWWF